MSAAGPAPPDILRVPDRVSQGTRATPHKSVSDGTVNRRVRAGDGERAIRDEAARQLLPYESLRHLVDACQSTAGTGEQFVHLYMLDTAQEQ